MRKSLMLSNLRIEIRRKQAGYPTEKTMIGWTNKFFDEMSIAHSSQIRDWQKDLFLSKLQKSGEISYEDQLQARSSLLFLFEKVLKQSNGFNPAKDNQENDPGVLRITA